MRTTVMITMLLSTGAVQADILYATKGSSFYRVDTEEQTAKLIGSTNVVLDGIAASSEDEVYAVRNGQLYSVEPATGDATPTGHFLGAVDIAYCTQDGFYYAVTKGTGFFCINYMPPMLFVFDPETGEKSSIVALNIEEHGCPDELVGEMIEFDADGVPYVVIKRAVHEPGSSSRSLLQVDLASGDTSYVATVGNSDEDGGAALVRGMAARDAGGLWGSFILADPNLTFGSFDPAAFSLSDPDTIDAIDLVGVEDELTNLAIVPSSCGADVNGDGALDILDFVTFQELFLADDPAADCNADGALSILDFVCFQQLFQAGCD